MKTNENEFKQSAVLVVSVMGGLVAVLTLTLVWLVGSEFGAENELVKLRAQMVDVEISQAKAMEALKTADSKLAKLKARQPVPASADTGFPPNHKDASSLQAKVLAAEADAERAGKSADVAREELRHAIEQSRKLEENFKAQIAQLQSEKEAALKNNPLESPQDRAAVENLKTQLASTLTLLKNANDEIQTLRKELGDQSKPAVSTLPPRVPLPTQPISSPPAQPVAERSKIFGQIVAVDSPNFFSVAHLNSTQGVVAGSSLTVTRQGIPVGILKVNRVLEKNVVITTLSPDLRDKVRKGDQVFLEP